MNRKSVVAFKIVELMKDENNQVIVLSHDISFVEKIDSFKKSNVSIEMTELQKDLINPFKDLNIKDYLTTDEDVYYSIIKSCENSNQPIHKIIGAMALRPYASIILCNSDKEDKYADIERTSTHLAHSVYSHSKRVPYERSRLSIPSMRAYCKQVAEYTKIEIDETKLIPEDWSFCGFDYNKSWEVYSQIPMITVQDIREKALVFRVLLETSLYMLVQKNLFDPERIGSEYKKAINGARGEKKNLLLELNRLYDFSKKYHHGADEASTLGLSALNPDEMRYYNEKITKIHDWIVNNYSECNSNANKHTV